MRRTICMILAAFTLTSVASAQEVEVLPSPELTPVHLPRWGVRLQADVNWPSDGMNTYSSGTGFTVGMTYNQPLYKDLYIEPGVVVYYNSLNMKDFIEDNLPYSSAISNLGVRVPLNFGYRFKLTDAISLSLFTGPWFNFNLSAKQGYSPNFRGGDEKKSKDLFDYGWHRFDAQWGFGVNVTFSGRYVIGLSGAVGSSALMSKDIDGQLHRMRRNSFAVTLGYNF